MIIQKHSIPKAALTVFLFWFVILLIFDQQGITKLPLNLGMMALAIGFGVFFAYWANFDIRREREKAMKGGEIRGLKSSLKLPPIHIHDLKKADKLLQGDALDAVQPPEFAGTNYLEKWRKQYGKTHPAYVALFDELLLTFSAKEYIGYPATNHTKPGHNHGGRSLITHSLLVCQLMLVNSGIFEYKPQKGRKLLNPDFRFDAEDPLIPIIGLAHDLGKIECLEQTENGEWTMRSGHAQMGARAIARLESYWHTDIDADSRHFLSLIIAYYHNPQNIPTNEKGGVISDRLHALLELLIACDRQAGRIENGADNQIYSAKNQRELEKIKAAFEENLESAQKIIATGVNTDAQSVKSMEDAMLKIFNQSGRINGTDTRSVGIRCGIKGREGSYIILHEDKFAEAVAEEMGVSIDDFEMVNDEKYEMRQDMKRKNKQVNHVRQFVRKILRLMTQYPVTEETSDEEENITVNTKMYHFLANLEDEGYIRSPEMSVYKVDFVEGRWFTDKTRNQLKDDYRREGYNEEGKKVGWFSWDSVIVIKADQCPTRFSAVHDSEDSEKLTAIVIGGRMGSTGRTTEKGNEMVGVLQAAREEAEQSAGGDEVAGNLAYLMALQKSKTQSKPAKAPQKAEEAPIETPTKGEPSGEDETRPEAPPAPFIEDQTEAAKQPEPVAAHAASPAAFFGFVREIYSKHKRRGLSNVGESVKADNQGHTLRVTLLAWDKAGQAGEPDYVYLFEGHKDWLLQVYGLQVELGPDGRTQYNVNAKEWMPAAGIKRLTLNQNGSVSLYVNFNK